jgi:hypothetical protein
MVVLLRTYEFNPREIKKDLTAAAMIIFQKNPELLSKTVDESNWDVIHSILHIRKRILKRFVSCYVVHLHFLKLVEWFGALFRGIQFI